MDIVSILIGGIITSSLLTLVVVPVLQLFLYRYSSGLVAPADTNTGLNFVTRANVARYLTTKSRFEGSSSRERYPVA